MTFLLVKTEGLMVLTVKKNQMSILISNSFGYHGQW